MGEDQQEAEQRRRFNLPAGVDPRNYDPRKITDPAMRDRIFHAQAIARAEAQAASTVLIATIVSLVTSAFTFVAALAWNTAIQELLNENISGRFKNLNLSPGTVAAIYAAIVTLIAVVVVVIVNRFAGDLAKKSAIAAATGK